MNLRPRAITATFPIQINAFARAVTSCFFKNKIYDLKIARLVNKKSYERFITRKRKQNAWGKLIKNANRNKRLETQHSIVHR